MFQKKKKKVIAQELYVWLSTNSVLYKLLYKNAFCLKIKKKVIWMKMSF